MVLVKKKPTKYVKKFNMKPTFIFSASKGGEDVDYILNVYGVKAIAFIDNSRDKQKKLYLGRKVLSPEKAFKKFGKNGCNYVIASISYYESINQQLLKMGVNPESIFYGQSISIFFDRGKMVKPFSLTQDQLNKLKKVMLDIVQEVHDICRRHNIKYYMYDGTLLGAVRHKGYIPWDDDIDLAMFRNDYEKFIKICKKELSEEFVLVDPARDKHAVIKEWTIRKKNTVREFARPYALLKNHKEIYIDIFVLDNVKVKNGRMQRFQKMVAVLCAQAMLYRNGMPSNKTDQHKFITKLMSVLPVRAIMWINDSVLKLYNGKKTKYVHHFYERQNYDEVADRTFKRSDFKDRVLMDFEDRKFWAPKNYHVFLAGTYGEDYMSMPPEKDRYTNHDNFILKFEDDLKKEN